MTKAQAQGRLQKLFSLLTAIRLRAFDNAQYNAMMDAVERRNAKLHPLDIPCDAPVHYPYVQLLGAQAVYIRTLSQELGFAAEMPTAVEVEVAIEELKRAHGITLAYSPERPTILKRLQQ